MLFENVLFQSTINVMIISFIVGFFVFLISFYLMKRNLPGKKKVFKGALLGGIASSFLLTIVIATLVPSVVIVEKDLSYSECYSLWGNQGFLGIGGCYIINNSESTLQLVGIGDDDDIYITIDADNTKKTRKLPEVFFMPVPKEQSVKVSYTKRGRKKVIKGPSVYLIEK